MNALDPAHAGRWRCLPEREILEEVKSRSDVSFPLAPRGQTHSVHEVDESRVVADLRE